MISLDTPLAGLDGLCLGDFWQLPVSKDFDFQPEYYFGQTVLHKMKVNGGEILHPVEVFGIMWDRHGWEYGVLLPEEHPEFEKENNELIWVNFWQLEAM